MSGVENLDHLKQHPPLGLGGESPPSLKLNKMKSSKVLFVRDYAGDFKTKLILENGDIVKVAKGTAKAGHTIGYESMKKGDTWTNVDGTTGVYENDFNKFIGTGGGMTAAKREELTFLHSLSQVKEED